MASETPDIETAAAAPKRTTVDGTTVEEHDLEDLIAVDKHLAGKRARSKVTDVLSSMRAKIKPPGGGG